MRFELLCKLGASAPFGCVLSLLRKLSASLVSGLQKLGVAYLWVRLGLLRKLAGLVGLLLLQHGQCDLDVADGLGHGLADEIEFANLRDALGGAFGFAARQ